MLKLNEFWKSKIQFEVSLVEKTPKDYYTPENWEQGEGVYYSKETDYIYFVDKHSVNSIYAPFSKGLFTLIEDEYQSPKVEEDLFLKSLAALNGHRL
jgi:hypothetical protein